VVWAIVGWPPGSALSGVYPGVFRAIVLRVGAFAVPNPIRAAAVEFVGAAQPWG
jgi:hypothetical protein